ncbi:VCBS repeat-containing protein [Micromonospora sp. NPDC050495]|uniref:FG-GAP repeat domain-containing protein n=1 Tax=Micromonospora sp. NPDC050495 TaxID=3154936 RepID=UPI0033ED2C9A
MGRSLRAGFLASTLALGLLVVPAAPVVAAGATATPTATAPREIAVFPANEPTAPAHEAIIFAGTTGFLHRHDASTDYLWTRYDTGATVVVGDLAGLAPSALKPAGGDLISIRTQVPAKPAPGRVSVLDLSDQTWQQWAVPTGSNGYTIAGIYGDIMIGQQWVNGTLGGPRLLTFAADGTIASSTPVTVPEGARPSSVNVAVAGDLTSAVVGYQDGTGSHCGLLDFATARIVPVPGSPAANLGGIVWRLTGDTLGWASYSTDGGRYSLYSRSGLADGTNTGARTLSAPYDTIQRSVIVGDGLVVSRFASGWGATTEPAVAVPADGGAGTTVLPRVDAENTALVQAPDGTALVVGGTGPRDWAVRRITGQPGRTPTTTPLLPVRNPVTTAGLLYHQGLVRHVQAQVVPPYTAASQYAIYNHPIVTDRSIMAIGTTIPHPPASCAAAASCVRLLEGNGEGAVYLASASDGTTDKLYSFKNLPFSYSTTELPTHRGQVVDVGNRLIVVNDGTTKDQYLVDRMYGTTTRLGSVAGAALWFDTLWRSTGTAGQLTSVDRKTRATRTVATGAQCVPTELQTSVHWLYWSCGATGPAGVYDLDTNRNLSLPAGPVLLGDGFVVRHDGAGLQLTDFHDGTVHAPVRLADLPAGSLSDDRRVTWTVDRHGSGVAYADAGNAVHVLDTGVPASRARVGSFFVNGAVLPRDRTSGLNGSFQLTRPINGWLLTVTHKWSRKVVYTRSGGAVRDRLVADWDGRLADGTPALNGPYRYTLTATTQPDAGAVLLASQGIAVGCGTFPFHGYDCYGGSALLAVKADGEGHWYGTRQDGVVPGRLSDNGQTETWCVSCRGTLIVPFGDYNGDALPDLLVRDENGYLRAHLGIGQLSFGSRTTKSLGSGWGSYRSILAPGDVNSDRHDDILAIDGSGRLWLFTTTGTGGFAARVQVGSGWDRYARVVGAGDLNGDGHGDLVAIDGTGVMYRYLSNGRKGWSSGVRVSSGWNGYNAVIPIGDLNEDGRNDLLARDPSGYLWHYAGLGNGTFAARVKVGTGWNMYKTIA